MTRPKLLYYAILEYQLPAKAAIEDYFDVVERATPDDADDAVLAGVEACFAPLGFQFDAARMERCPKLKAILSNTTGVPHIDMAAAKERGIEVFALHDQQDFLDTITPTAEHAFGLIMALTRNLPRAFNDVLDGNWNRFDHGGRAMLSRLDLGIVGLGRLGRHVAKYAAAFGMGVRYYDPYVEATDGGPERLESLSDLIEASDIVSLHAPANDETRHLINSEILAAFPSHGLLINTARGELVDEAALLRALKSGTIAGAALDVLDGEYATGFAAAEHPLVKYAREHDNFILTPHIGGSTRDAWTETQQHVVDRAIAYFEQGGG